MTVVWALMPLELEAKPITFQVPRNEPKPLCETQIILEINLYGKGMIWPNRRTISFLRLYRNGCMEYDARTTKGIIRRKTSLNQKELSEFISIGQRSDFLNASDKYPELESMRDAVLVTFINFYYQDKIKRIEIINYEPDHPRAKQYYPSSLRELLKQAVKKRPVTTYERKIGPVNPGIPYT
jgi:hypothetical protein